MDGAMKFVKGDAIAGLVIVAVNLLGGITIGTLQRGLTAGEAMQVYSILTIGDGLISQIPALFISIAAGIIVTRVTTGEGPSNVGRDIGAQVLSQPKALLIGTAVMTGFALIPGMPTLTFLGLAVLVGGVGYVLFKGEVKTVDAATGQSRTVSAIDLVGGADASGSGTPGRPAADGATFQPTVPLMVDVCAHLESAFSASVLNEELARVRRALYMELGVVFPGLQLRFTPQRNDDTYLILVGEIPVSQGHLKPDRLLVRESVEHLKALRIPFEEGPRFLPGMPTLWVSVSLGPSLQQAGIAYLEPMQMLSFHIAQVLRRHAGEFIGIQETRALLSEAEARYPELVKEAVRVMPVNKIAEILQRLVSEEISIRNVRTVLESLVEWGQKEKDPVLLTEYVRIGLKRYISHKHAGGQNTLAAYLLAPAIEDEIRAAIRQTSGGSYLALDPAASRRIVTAIRKTVHPTEGGAARTNLLTSMDIRRYLRKLIEQDMPQVAVLSYQELSPDVNIQPLAKVDA
jgi:type III secretion protein V